MKTIIIKGATINQLWDAHSDIANWAQWQDKIEWTKVEGKISKGSKFTIKPKSGPKVNLEVLTYDKPKQFTDISYGMNSEWYWDFGDGNTSSLQNPLHTELQDPVLRLLRLLLYHQTFSYLPPCGFPRLFLQTISDRFRVSSSN